MSNNIILIGFMGAGKSSVGRELAKLLNYIFIDTDALIESNLNLKIKDIFNQFGEDYFRAFERRICEWLFSHVNNCVIATGGGAPLHWEGLPYLNTGRIIFLNTSLENIKCNLKGDFSRPLFKENNLSNLYESRIEIYKKIAHHKIDCNKDSIQDIAIKIVRSLECMPC